MRSMEMHRVCRRFTLACLPCRVEERSRSSMPRREYGQRGIVSFEYEQFSICVWFFFFFAFAPKYVGVFVGTFTVWMEQNETILSFK